MFKKWKEESSYHALFGVSSTLGLIMPLTRRTARAIETASVSSVAEEASASPSSASATAAVTTEWLILVVPFATELTVAGDLFHAGRFGHLRW